MKATWRFFAGVGLGVLVLLLLNMGAFALILGVPTKSSRWAYEINHKKEGLAATMESPRLFIVGGSSALFGISAREIEKETGWHSLNLGTHAALGAPFMMTLAERVARPGDVVLLALEYEIYDSDTARILETDNLWIDYVVSREPGYFHHLPLDQQWNIMMLTSVPQFKAALRIRFNPKTYADSDFGTNIYSPSHINQWGDQTGHIRAGATRNFKSRLSILGRGLPEHPAGFNSIAAFCRWAKTNQVRVLATYPNLADQPALRSPTAKRSVARIADFFAEQGVTVVGEYTEALLPQDEFFDTMYHLTEEAAVDRTQQLVKKLKPILGAHDITSHTNVPLAKEISK